MSEIDFQKEFVQRTKDLFDKCEKCARENDREFTLLINCLLGLITIVYEKIDSNFLNEKIACIPELETLSNFKTLNTTTLGKFLKHFRNALSHNHIESNNEGEEWKNITIWDECYCGTITFNKTILTYDEIKIITDYIFCKYGEFLETQALVSK